MFKLVSKLKGKLKNLNKNEFWNIFERVKVVKELFLAKC